MRKTSRRGFLGWTASLIPVSFLGFKLPDGPGWRRGRLTTSEPVECKDINLDMIDSEAEWVYWSDSHVKQLAESVQKHGLVNPILVRRLRGNRYAVVRGYRRVAACRYLGHKTIRACITNMNNLEALDHQAHESRHDPARTC